MKLSELKAYGVCRIVGIDEYELTKRLTGLGFYKGAEAVRLFSAPNGDPTAYLIRGTVVALRERDAERISVEVNKAWA